MRRLLLQTHSATDQVKLKHLTTFQPPQALCPSLSTMTTMMSMSIDVNPAMMDSIPRLRWSPANNRFHYNLPVASEPGDRGFVLLQEFEHADSFGTWALPASERHHLEEMERINALISDVENAVHLRETVKFLENQRVHHEEFHERDVTDEDVKDRVTKKKDLYRHKQAPKRTFESRRQKPARLGRVHQPK